MEFVIIGLIVLVIILLVFLLLKVSSNKENDISLSKVEGDIIREIGDFKLNFSRDLMEDFNKLNDRIEHKLNMIMIRLMKDLMLILKKLIKTLHQF